MLVVASEALLMFVDFGRSLMQDVIDVHSVNLLILSRWFCRNVLKFSSLTESLPMTKRLMFEISFNSFVVLTSFLDVVSFFCAE